MKPRRSQRAMLRRRLRPKLQQRRLHNRQQQPLLLQLRRRLQVTPAPASNADVKATPLARKLADDNGLDMKAITGTGASGRIREQDVLAYIQTHQEGSA